MELDKKMYPAPFWVQFTCLGLLAVFSCRIGAQPMLVDPAVGHLELVSSSPVLERVDGLAFDAYGNLFAALETAKPNGGVVYVDKATGAVTDIAIGITGSDQIKFHPSGTLYATNEFAPGLTSNRLFEITIQYSPANIPLSGSFNDISTDTGIDNPEGLIILQQPGAFGPTGTVYVTEDKVAGRILKIDMTQSPATVTSLVDETQDLQRPEGITFGDFNGVLPSMSLFVAETLDDNILRIDASGAVSVFGDPTMVNLERPDNLNIGPDGYLYVAEDHTGLDRVIRIAADGTHELFGEGFSAPAGLTFDPFTGDLYISEQATDSIWRVVFSAPLRCDLNDNGKVDAGDLLRVVRMLADEIADDLDCDMNNAGLGDGVISAADLVILTRMVLGIIPAISR